VKDILPEGLREVGWVLKERLLIDDEKGVVETDEVEMQDPAIEGKDQNREDDDSYAPPGEKPLKGLRCFFMDSEHDSPAVEEIFR